MFSSALRSISNYSNSITIDGIMATIVSVPTAMTAIVRLNIATLTISRLSHTTSTIMETMMRIIAKTG